jgi:flagellar hook assembly protein FlgD
LEIFDALGHHVLTLVDDIVSAGVHTIKWEGKNNNDQKVSSGVYFIRMTAGAYVQQKKMIFIQ